MIEVIVYAGVAIVESKVCSSEESAIAYASVWQDRGFKVRLVEV